MRKIFFLLLASLLCTCHLSVMASISTKDETFSETIGNKTFWSKGNTLIIYEENPGNAIVNWIGYTHPNQGVLAQAVKEVKQLSSNSLARIYTHLNTAVALPTETDLNIRESLEKGMIVSSHLKNILKEKYGM